MYHESTTWWRYQIEVFSGLLAICARNSLVTDDIPPQRLLARSFDVFFDLRLNKRLSKQEWGWWVETASRPLWRHYNEAQRTGNYSEIVSTFYLNLTKELNTKFHNNQYFGDSDAYYGTAQLLKQIKNDQCHTWFVIILLGDDISNKNVSQMMSYKVIFLSYAPPK